VNDTTDEHQNTADNKLNRIALKRSQTPSCCTCKDSRPYCLRLSSN